MQNGTILRQFLALFEITVAYCQHLPVNSSVYSRLYLQYQYSAWIKSYDPYYVNAGRPYGNIVHITRIPTVESSAYQFDLARQYLCNNEPHTHILQCDTVRHAVNKIMTDLSYENVVTLKYH